jgi:hypothetical protein
VRPNTFPEKPGESHVVTAVFLLDLGKWGLAGPDTRGVLMDEEGVLLRIGEIRERLVAGDSSRRPLGVDDGGSTQGGDGSFHKARSRGYLLESPFRLDGPAESEPDRKPSPSGRTHIGLFPGGHHAESLTQPRVMPRGNAIVCTNHAADWGCRPSVVRLKTVGAASSESLVGEVSSGDGETPVCGR